MILSVHRWHVIFLAASTQAELIRGDPDLIVPAVVPELSGKSVLTSEWMNGQPIDEVAGLPEDERNAVARAMLRLCLKEVFEFRKVQTDPNWSNFLYDPV
eukprot:SAG31_NODE_2068_length_6521_cov_6.298194_5_plen_100_part_00